MTTNDTNDLHTRAADLARELSELNTAWDTADDMRTIAAAGHALHDFARNNAPAIADAFDALATLATSEHDMRTAVERALVISGERCAALASENAKYAAILADPNAVHLNIMRGMIALGRMNALHIAGATDYDAVKAENAKLREALMDMVNQHCTDRTGFMSDGALSANEFAIDLLVDMGLMRRVSERPLQYGWVENAFDTLQVPEK